MAALYAWVHGLTTPNFKIMASQAHTFPCSPSHCGHDISTIYICFLDQFENWFGPLTVLGLQSWEHSTCASGRFLRMDFPLSYAFHVQAA